MNDSYVDTLLIDVGILGQWAVENAMKINPGKSKAVGFTRARVKDRLNYYFFLGGGKEFRKRAAANIQEQSRSDLNWADEVNYTLQKAWKALHFRTRVLKKGSSNTESLAYMSLVRPILEYGASCRDPYGEGQINALDRVQRKAAANHTKPSGWETLAQRRKTARICPVFKAYTGEQAWKAIGDRLKGPCYLSRDDQDRKISARQQTTDIG